MANTAFPNAIFNMSALRVAHISRNRHAFARHWLSPRRRHDAEGDGRHRDAGFLVNNSRVVLLLAAEFDRRRTCLAWSGESFV